VTIVETDFFDEHTDPDLLHDISVDAARLADHLRDGEG
jgi:hypothetical protein